MLEMEKLIAFAVILQSIEYLQIKSSFTQNGIWTWRTVRREFTGLPKVFLRILDFILNDRNFLVLLLVRLLVAVLALIFPSSLLWAFLWVSTLLVSIRWRGTFNGGSDTMTLIVLMAAFFSRFATELSHPGWVAIALGYVAVQTVLSFFIAGVIKLRNPEWRDGRALIGFMSSGYYGAHTRTHSLNGFMQSPIFSRIGSWSILLFECLFPLALLDPRLCLIVIVLALGFQLMNTYLFGLNRFFWAWLAAYPALYTCTVYLHQMRSY